MPNVVPYNPTELSDFVHEPNNVHENLHGVASRRITKSSSIRETFT